MPDSPEQREHDRLVRGGRYSPLLEEVEGLRARVAELEGALAALVSDHDGVPAVWVCEQCGQPLGKDGRCNSSLHVPPEAEAEANGMAVATTDLVAELRRAEARAGSLEEALEPFAAVWRRMVDDDRLFEPVRNQSAYRAAWHAVKRPGDSRS